MMQTKDDDPASRGFCLLLSIILSGVSWWCYWHDETLKAIFWAIISFKMNPSPAIVSGIRRVLRQVKEDA